MAMKSLNVFSVFNIIPHIQNSNYCCKKPREVDVKLEKKIFNRQAAAEKSWYTYKNYLFKSLNFIKLEMMIVE